MVTALVCSARAQGDCLALASYLLSLLKERGHDTRLISFREMQVSPCNRCDYECLAPVPSCPVDDDVPHIWSQVWDSDAVIWSVPSYGGLPPASWIAFGQRLQGLVHPIPHRRRPIAVICIANSKGATAGERTAKILTAQAEQMGFLVDIAVFGTAQYGRRAIDGDLIEELPVRHRLDEIVDRLDRRV